MDDQPPISENQPPAAGDMAVATSPAAVNPPVVPDPAAAVDQAPPARQPTADPQASGADQSPAAAANNPAPPVPSLKHCLTVISAGKNKGLDAIPELPALLEPECPELAEILESASITTSLETFGRRDKESIAQQTDLKFEANRANLCLLAAGVTSAVILAVAATAGTAAGQVAEAAKDAAGQSSVDPSTGRFNITLVLGLLTLAFGAGAAYFNFVARDQGRVSRWQASRSDAEAARQAVFTTMASAAGGKSAKAVLFGLAVVVRDLLEDQRSYLDKAAQRHRKSSEISSRWGGLGGSLAFIGGSGAIVASQGGALWTNWIILAGVFGAAIGAYAANREALNRDRANADRYERTLVALDGIKGRTDDIARQIMNGERKALAIFTGAITDLLATEFKQWQEGTAQAEASLGKLDGQLRELSKNRAQGDDKAGN
jgi:hypothetical protein